MGNKKVKEPKVLYHYCSAETFFNIIKNDSIWMSDISKSNDSKELSWIKERSIEYIKEKIITYAKMLKKEGRLIEAPFEDVEQVCDLIKFNVNNETEKCWVFCLSEKDDDLGQWRGYSQDGSGVSIGFKTEYLQKIVKENSIETFSDEKIHFKKIKYFGYKQKNKLFNELVGKIDFENTSKDDFVAHLQKIAVSVLLYSPFFKSNYFKEEKEWRLAFSMHCNEIHRGKIPSINNEYVTSKYEYSLTRGDLISHIELDFKNMKDAISSIRLGPKCKLSEREIKLFLLSKGYLKNINDNSIIVKKSNGSYR